MTLATRYRRTIDRLAKLEDRITVRKQQLTYAYAALGLTLPDGYPAGTDTGSGYVSGGGSSDPTLAAIIHRILTTDGDADDPENRAALAAIETHLTVIEKALDEMHVELTQLTARALQQHEIADPPGAGECMVCGRYCAGGPDRIRSGMCDADRKAWERWRQDWTGSGEADRTDFIRSRKAHLATHQDDDRERVGS